jgi:hypothetical protein
MGYKKLDIGLWNSYICLMNSKDKHPGIWQFSRRNNESEDETLLIYPSDSFWFQSNSFTYDRFMPNAHGYNIFTATDNKCTQWNGVKDLIEYSPKLHYMFESIKEELERMMDKSKVAKIGSYTSGYEDAVEELQEFIKNMEYSVKPVLFPDTLTFVGECIAKRARSYDVKNFLYSWRMNTNSERTLAQFLGIAEDELKVWEDADYDYQIVQKTIDIYSNAMKVTPMVFGEDHHD